jgi:hypothetical protein
MTRDGALARASWVIGWWVSLKFYISGDSEGEAGTLGLGKEIVLHSKPEDRWRSHLAIRPEHDPFG